MSNVYNLEPPTSGKVVLKTSHGDIEVELWPKEAPKAVRNFVQLCLEGYYDGTIFHRIIPGLAVQGGDPTGMGTGGDSVFGEPFKDEFHSRLRFSHRGIVACANPNSKDANGSQFFITLDKAEGLNKKHTIFGKVAGDTIYNVAAMGELEVDEDDRPLQPPVLMSVEVLWNPFPDIQPRITAEERRKQRQQEAEASKQAAKAARPKKKNVTLLSFGEEAAEEDAVLASAPKIVSAHDAIEDARLAKQHAEDLEAFAEAQKQPRMKQAEDQEHSLHGRRATSPGHDLTASDRIDPEHGDALAARNALKRKQLEGAAAAPGLSMDDRLKAKVAAARGTRGSGPDGMRAADKQRDCASEDEDHDGEDDEDRDFTNKRRQAVLEKGKARSAVVAPSKQVTIENAKLLTDWQRKRAEYKARKRLGGTREKETLSKLTSFTQKLRSQGDDGGIASKGMTNLAAQGATRSGQHEHVATGAQDDGYDGKVREDLDHELLKPPSWRVDKYLQEVDEEGDNLGLAQLRAHRLKFVKIKDSSSRRDDVNDYMVLDPLADQGKDFNRQDQAAKKKENEWAGRALA